MVKGKRASEANRKFMKFTGNPLYADESVFHQHRGM